MFFCIFFGIWSRLNDIYEGKEVKRMRTDIALEACLNVAEEITGAEWTQENGEDKVVVSTVKT